MLFPYSFPLNKWQSCSTITYMSSCFLIHFSGPSITPGPQSFWLVQVQESIVEIPNSRQTYPGCSPRCSPSLMALSCTGAILYTVEPPESAPVKMSTMVIWWSQVQKWILCRLEAPNSQGVSNLTLLLLPSKFGKGCLYKVWVTASQIRSPQGIVILGKWPPVISL